MSRAIPRGVGLLGGSFDPVHNGHLALARAALSQLGLARVALMPAARPWQKSVLTSIEQRRLMLELALGDDPRLALDLSEAARGGGLSYTIDTARRLRLRYGPAEPLVLLLGADQWLNLHTWKQWRRLTDYLSLAVADRDGAGSPADPAVRAWAADRWTRPERINEYSHGRICHFAMAPHAASSSEIRRLIATLGRGPALERLRSWLPAAVARHIARARIY